jgi:TolA-binding protein
MNRLLILVFATLLAMMTALWISDAMSQVKPSTTITKKQEQPQPQVSGAETVTSQAQNLPVESRVEILEREIRKLRSELNQLSASTKKLNREFSGHRHRIHEGAMWVPAVSLWDDTLRNNVRHQFIMFPNHARLETSAPLRRE